MTTDDKKRLIERARQAEVHLEYRVDETDRWQPVIYQTYNEFINSNGVRLPYALLSYYEIRLSTNPMQAYFAYFQYMRPYFLEIRNTIFDSVVLRAYSTKMDNGDYYAVQREISFDTFLLYLSDVIMINLIQMKAELNQVAAQLDNSLPEEIRQ